jgi:hypothetical protein
MTGASAPHAERSLALAVFGRRSSVVGPRRDGNVHLVGGSRLSSRSRPTTDDRRPMTGASANVSRLALDRQPMTDDR